MSIEEFNNDIKLPKLVFVNHPLSDSLTRLKNATMRKTKIVYVHKINIMIGVLEVLKHEGYVKSFEVLEKYWIKVELLYTKNEPNLRFLKIISKPGVRFYIGYKDLVKYCKNRFEVYILSTSQGVMSHMDAYKNRVGGELLVEVR